MHISADVFAGRKSLVKPVIQQKTCNYIVVWDFHPRSSCTMHISVDVQRITLNASSCITILGGTTEQLNIIAGFLLRHWLYEWFSQFHSCGTYAILSQSTSIVFLSWTWKFCKFIYSIGMLTGTRVPVFLPVSGPENTTRPTRSERLNLVYAAMQAGVRQAKLTVGDNWATSVPPSLKKSCQTNQQTITFI